MTTTPRVPFPRRALTEARAAARSPLHAPTRALAGALVWAAISRSTASGLNAAARPRRRKKRQACGITRPRSVGLRTSRIELRAEVLTRSARRNAPAGGLSFLPGLACFRLGAANLCRLRPRGAPGPSTES